MIWLHRHRADVLGALALAARGREPLAPALRRLAEIDSTLKRWAERIAPRLDQGEALPEVLRRARVISRDEAVDLALAPDQAHELHCLAARARDAPIWTWPLTHPGSAILVIMFAPVLTFLLLRACTGQLLVSSFPRELGMAVPVPDLTILAFGAALIGFEHGIGQLRGLRHVRALWCAEILRERALLRLLKAARTDDKRGVDLPQWARVLSAFGCWADRHNRPAWDTDWRTWRALSWFRLDRSTRVAARQAPSIAQRLLLCGMVAENEDGLDWSAAEEACRDRLQVAAIRKRTLVRPILLLAGCAGAFLLISTMLGNVLSIILELGKGW